MKTRTTLAIFWLFALVFWNISVWKDVFRGSADNLTVAFLDVGQGDAIFIEAPNGSQMLIDGGEDGAILDRLREIMPFTDLSIDIVLATHPDSDHIGGLDDVLKKYSVANIIDNGRKEKETFTFENLEKEIKKETETSQARYIQGKHGMRIILDKERAIYFDILFPATSTLSDDSNELSIVGKLVYGETEFLLTGDSGIEVEDKLMAWCKACLESDVLKVGHHGSKTSSGKSFIEAVHPDYAVISAGAKNTYGHPHQEVVKRLEDSKIKIIETAKTGTIIFESDGREVELRAP